MRKPLLSIIIPFYNLEHWLLERCLTSIVCQPVTPDDYEIIVVDDGSTTSPEPVIDKFTAYPIRLCRQENRGLGGARNAGMAISEGRFILFVDSDDYLFDQTLPPCMDVLRNSVPDLLSFRFKVTGKQNREQNKQQPVVFFPVTSGAEFMSRNNVPGCAWLYIFRKALAAENNIAFTEGIYHEDEEFTAKIYFFARKLIVSNLLMYAYYQRNDSIINRKGNSHLNKRFEDLGEIIERLCEFKEQTRRESNEKQQLAIERKLHLLTGDFIISMVRKFFKLSYITSQTKKLRSCGVYPLPRRNYSFKYKVFRNLANHKPGICLLYLIEWFRSKTNKL